MAPAESSVPARRDPAIDTALRVGILALLLAWCFLVLRPFLVPIVWGIIIAIGVEPIFFRLKSLVGGRNKTAATLFTLLALAFLLTPTFFLASSAIQGVETLATQLSEGTLTVPPPSDKVAGWPLIGKRLHEIWQLASTNLQEALAQVEPQAREYGAKLVSAAVGVGMLVVQFVISLLIAGIFLANQSGARRTAELLCTRLVGERGGKLVELAGATITSVVRGVVGVAIIQSFAAGLGMVVVGIPLAGLWALLVLVLAVIQLPTVIVLGPLCIYAFSVESTSTAVMFLIWSIIVGVSDTFLKPLLLGRGVDVPMPAILLGAIGGMILHGIIGLFVGAVVLAVTFKLYRSWIHDLQEEAEGASAAAQGGASGSCPG